MSGPITLSEPCILRHLVHVLQVVLVDVLLNPVVKIGSMSLVLRQPAPEHLPLPHHHISVPRHPLQLYPHPMVLINQLLVVHLQVASHQHTLGSAVLRVASVLQCSPLLFELDNFVTRISMQPLVQLTHTQVHQLKIVNSKNQKL